MLAVNARWNVIYNIPLPHVCLSRNVFGRGDFKGGWSSPPSVKLKASQCDCVPGIAESDENGTRVLIGALHECCSEPHCAAVTLNPHPLVKAFAISSLFTSSQKYHFSIHLKRTYGSSVLAQRPLTAAVTLPMAIETGAFQDRLEISAASQGGCKHHKERHLLATPTRM